MIRKFVQCSFIFLLAAVILLTGCGVKNKTQQTTTVKNTTSRTVKTESVETTTSTGTKPTETTASAGAKPTETTASAGTKPSETTIPAVTKPTETTSSTGTKPTETTISTETKPTETTAPSETKPSEPLTSAEPGSWVKYTAGGVFSFHYPEGWAVETNESIVLINNEKTDEQLLMAAIPFDKEKDAAALANDFISLLKYSNPNAEASNWRVDSYTDGNQAIFDLTDESGGKKYNGSGIAVKDNQQAIWISYVAPAATYSRDRGKALIQGFMQSFASGSDSKNPNVIYELELTEKIDRNARGFLFMLEFAMGAPFTGSQEQVILDDLKSVWRNQTVQELAKYDQYPVLSQAVLMMGQNDLAELRKELEKTVTEWINGTTGSDESIEIIKNQLNIRGKAVIAGEPPLTEMSLTAYSEIIAYSRLLRQNPEALPDQISLDSVNEIKNEVRDAWGSFTAKEREQVANSPGLWFCMRTLMNNGSESERDNIRSELLKLSKEAQTAAGNNGSSSEGTPMSMAEHNTILWMQQFTANHYLYTHGYYSTFFGGTW